MKSIARALGSLKVRRCQVAAGPLQWFGGSPK
jgi:hypothetical protein